ncbi:unnamed protein product, partial [Nesidiocoris tenuis]
MNLHVKIAKESVCPDGLRDEEENGLTCDTGFRPHARHLPPLTSLGGTFPLGCHNVAKTIRWPIALFTSDRHSHAERNCRACSTSTWDNDILNRWISEHPLNTESLFQVARHLALLLLLASSRRIHNLTLLLIDVNHLQTVGPNKGLWPSFGSKTDGPTRIQSGWLLKADPTRPIWNIPAWIDTYLMLRSKQCGSEQVPALFISSRGMVKPASLGTIVGWVSTALLAAGISATPGSTRSAVSSALARTHTPLYDIMARANWRSSTTFLRHYYRPLDNPNASLVSPAAFTPTIWILHPLKRFGQVGSEPEGSGGDRWRPSNVDELPAQKVPYPGMLISKSTDG